MSFWILDDYYETVWTDVRCHCGGNPASETCAAPGHCTASASCSMRPRAPEEVLAIKAEKQRRYEEAVLAEADAIHARRYQG